MQLNFIQMAIAVKKILYAADAKESALAEAQDYLFEAMNGGENETENEPWVLTNNGGSCPLRLTYL